MKQIVQNIKAFINKEFMIFCITVFCIFISALLLNFSYGLYQNYHVMRIESESDLNRIMTKVGTGNDGEKLTKEKLLSYLNALSEKTLDAMDIIAVSAVYPDLYCVPSEEGGGNKAFWYRFCIRNGNYCISKPTKDSWEKNGMIVNGRYLNNEEESSGANVAMIANKVGFGISDNTKSLMTNENTIKLWGKEYQIIGEYSGGWDTPIIPFLSAPDDTTLKTLTFDFYSNVTRSQYDELRNTASEIIPGILTFPELNIPDTDTYYLYNNVMLISALLALLSALNFAMLYQYILQKRRKRLAVFRICGCTKWKAFRSYIGECMAISIPAYAVGTAVFGMLLENVFDQMFPYMKAAYSPAIYLSIFAIYAAIVLVVLSVLILSTFKKQIAEEWRA